jgi:parvulin-like peptidyl-prolyl isomerase
MKLLREPLVHFAVAGGLLFAAYAVVNRGVSAAGATDRTIRITERELTWLTETSARSSQRALEQSELPGLVADYLREELLAREARALELDRDDTVVRRRLAQKMNFILEDTARLASPTDADLRARFQAGQARFQTTPRSSFEHVYFSADKRGDRAVADAREALARLRQGGPDAVPAAMGDASLLPATLSDADERAITTQFGAEFARAVAALEPGAWNGPVASEFGQHLVRVTARDAGRPRSFDEARAELVDDWRRDMQAAARAAYFAGLLRKYDVQATAATQPLLGPALAELTRAQP